MSKQFPRITRLALLLMLFAWFNDNSTAAVVSLAGTGLTTRQIKTQTDASTHSGKTFAALPGAFVLFIADYFKQCALAVADRAGSDLRWFVIDAIPVSNIDLNGVYALRDLRAALESRGVTLVVAGRRTEFLNWLRKVGLYQPEHDSRFFPTLRQALKAYERETRQVVADEE